MNKFLSTNRVQKRQQAARTPYASRGSEAEASSFSQGVGKPELAKVLPGRCGRGGRYSLLLVLLLGIWDLGLGVLPVSAGQATNSISRPDFASFKNIAANNIFNTHRSPGVMPTSERRQTLRSSRTESFALVGTMSYGEGPMAFFEGSKSDYRKMLKSDDMIAGFKLIAIETSLVKLASPTNEVELQMGMQLSREEEGPWRVSVRPESAEPSAPLLSSSRSSYQVRSNAEPAAVPSGDIPAGLAGGSPLSFFFQGGSPPDQVDPQTGINNNRPAATSGNDSDVLARLAARAAAERGQ